MSPDPNQGTDLTVQDALDNLPAEGGLVFVKQGNYAIATPIILPDKPIAIRGASNESTVLTIGAGLAISLFYDGFDRDRSFSDFSIQGDDTPGQVFYEAGPGNVFSTQGSFFRDMFVSGVEKCFKNDPAGFLGIDCKDFGWVVAPGPNPNALICDGSGSFTCYNSFFSDYNFGGTVGGFGMNGGATGWSINGVFAYLAIGNGAESHAGTGGVQCTETTFLGDDTAASVIRSSSSNADRISGCQFIQCYFEVGFLSQFVGCEFTNTATLARMIDVLANAAVTVSGCNFQSWISEAIRLDGGGINSIITGNYNCKVTEISSACQNRYDNNSGFDGSTILGADSVVNGMRRADSSSSTTAVFVTVFTHTNPKGLVGVGTIKNTGGANSLDVQETVTDAFGVTSSASNTVAPAADRTLNPQANIGTARPPYVSYAVAVKDTVAASHTTYELHHADQGAL